MAYLIISANGEELDRQELHGPVTLGRSPECEVSVHDILLSRRHCKLDPSPQGWVLTDLASKNGTLLAGQKITCHPLNDGDVFNVGRTRLTFHSGSYIPGPRKLSASPDSPRRPSDPTDALMGTVAGLVLSDAAPPPPIARPQRQMPNPKPRPADPVAFARDDIYTMLEEIASSSWDSIYANASRPARTLEELPRPIVKSPSKNDVSDHARQKHARPAGAPVRLNGRFPHANVCFDLQVANGSSGVAVSSVGALSLPHPRPLRHRRISSFARQAVSRVSLMGQWVTKVGLARIF